MHRASGAVCVYRHVKLVTCLPEASARISGSRVSRPVKRTLFTVRSLLAGPSPVFTTAEVGAILRLSDVTVRRLVRAGYLPRVPGVRVILVPRDAVGRLARGELRPGRVNERERHRD